MAKVEEKQRKEEIMRTVIMRGERRGGESKGNGVKRIKERGKEERKIEGTREEERGTKKRR